MSERPSEPWAGEPRALILSMRDVKDLLEMGRCIELQEEVFAQNGAGTAWNGENAWIYPDPEVMRHPGTGKMMAGAIEPDWWGMKVLGVGEGDPDNRARMQVLCLFRAETLTPVAVLEANYLGHIRTGAGAAVASRHLARPESRQVGVLGTGATARFALIAHAAMGWPVERVQVYSRSEERRIEYAKELTELTGYEIEPVADPETVVRGAEILISGTASHEPAFDADWVAPGTHVNAMGQRQEVPPELFGRSRNIGDEVAIAVADGKLSVAIGLGAITEADAHGSLGEVIIGKVDGRTSADDITLFDSSGLCVQDIAAGVHVWERARELGRGVAADLFHDDPLW